MSSFGLCEPFFQLQGLIVLVNLYTDIGSVRQFTTLNVLRPMAKALGLKKSKLFRFLERTSLFNFFPTIRI